MEAMNNNQDLIHGSLHSANQNFKSANYHNTATITITDTENTYNVYGCTWTPEAIEFDIDGIKYFRCERDLSKEYNPKDFPWTTPFYLLLNTSIRQIFFMKSQLVILVSYRETLPVRADNV